MKERGILAPSMAEDREMRLGGECLMDQLSEDISEEEFQEIERYAVDAPWAHFRRRWFESGKTEEELNAKILWYTCFTCWSRIM